MFAQVTAPEPEFINSYCILTSDATYDQLPKESGTLGKHENKVKKWGKLLGGAANVIGAGGMIGAATAGSVSGVINGVRVASTASSVASAAGTVSEVLLGIDGCVGVCLAAHLFGDESRLVQGTGSRAAKILGDERKRRPEGIAFQRAYNFHAGLFLHEVQQLQIC